MPLDDVAHLRKTGRIANPSQDDNFTPISLEDALLKIKGFQDRKVYYTHQGRDGRTFFGITGIARLFFLTPAEYTAVEPLPKTNTFKATYILERVFALRTQQQS